MQTLEGAARLPRFEVRCHCAGGTVVTQWQLSKEHKLPEVLIIAVHEPNAVHMAYDQSRVTGVCVAQNDPGITNFVTVIAAAY
jgi:thiamine pyrophosphate-dependent acetolactate synthase large subunit-like protein